jgi:uncharacterized protein (DUF433 family)
MSYSNGVSNHAHPFVQETPGVSGGYPCIGNSRIPVRLIVEYTRAGLSVADLLEMYPHLTAEQLHGTLDYYAKFPARVDEDIATNAQALADLIARTRNAGH